MPASQRPDQQSEPIISARLPPNAWTPAMRRKARLKVLYWPIFASVCIILILIAVGPFGANLRPAVTPFWAGGDLRAELLGWLPSGALGAKSITLPWTDLASSESRIDPKARVRLAPRTLVVQSDGHGLLGSRHVVEARSDLDSAALPRGFHSPHALRMQAAAAPSPVAEARLLAPRRDDVEELAGLDRAPTASMLLASQALTNEVRHGEWDADHDRDARVHVGDDIRDSTKRTADPARRGHGLGGGWPNTPQLIRDLETVVRTASQNGRTRFASSRAQPQSQSLETWKANVTESLQMLTALPSVHSPEAGPILMKLESLAAAGHEAGEAEADRDVQIQLLSVAHGLDRRVAVWQAVWRTAQGTVTRVSDLSPSAGGEATIDFHAATQLLSTLHDDVSSSDDPDGWSQFLMLEELEAANQKADAEIRRLAAQRFLSRLTWHRLSLEHRHWLDRPSVRNLEIVLRRWAAKPLDYAALLSQIERQESDSIDLGGIDVASAVQTLRFAQSREANRIAESLNTYYRNANLRVAITDELIRRMIPEIDTKIQPVRDTILGAEVRGTSLVHSDIGLRLIPSDRSWKLMLENHGRVETGASSRQWPVRIRSDSDAKFLSSTPLEITPDGAIAGSTNVDVQTATKVRGVRTDFDSIPLISSLVREIAISRYDSMAPLAEKIQKNKIRGGVRQEVDVRVSEQLDDAADLLARRLTGPLSTLQLNPLVVDMQTTSTRLSARYRVAGDWQLAAFTPRPRAPLSSLMSVQVHQSALNNSLEQILPAGESKSIHELIEQVKELFAIEGAAALEADDDLAADTSIQFASTRPITIEIEDGTLWITMRVMRLNQGKGIDLRRFIVRAGFRPEVQGLSARLVRDGHLRISGPDMSMRDRLPVRAIFNKVFSTKRSLPLLPERWVTQPSLEGLAVTQVELRDGWIALAIGHAVDAAIVPQVARVEEDEETPTKPY